jgi:Zn-dependent protease with chaperone function
MLDGEHIGALSLDLWKVKREAGPDTRCDRRLQRFRIAVAARAWLFWERSRRGEGVMRVWSVLALMVSLAGCVQAVSLPPLPPAQGQSAPLTTAERAKVQAEGQRKALMFMDAVRKVQPVATDLCRQKAIAHNCQFQIVIDPRLGLQANAYQTLDRLNRPVIALTLALIDDARDTDEIAFVMGHEAAHHILGHLALQDQTARAAAKVAGEAAMAAGASAAQVRRAQEQGAESSTLGYSKNLELQADALGAEIAYRAGFNPLRGAAFFDRLPEPHRGSHSTHPDNRTRKALVAKVMARLRRGG